MRSKIIADKEIASLEEARASATEGEVLYIQGAIDALKWSRNDQKVRPPHESLTRTDSKPAA